jgi:hypothetical protein
MRPSFIGASALLAFLLSSIANPLVAQQPATGTVQITIEESMGMVDGFLIHSPGRRATTDADGRACVTY